MLDWIGMGGTLLFIFFYIAIVTGLFFAPLFIWNNAGRAADAAEQTQAEVKKIRLELKSFTELMHRVEVGAIAMSNDRDAVSKKLAHSGNRPMES